MDDGGVTQLDKSVDKDSTSWHLSTAWSAFLKLFMLTRQQKSRLAHKRQKQISPCHRKIKMTYPLQKLTLTTTTI
jgi:hypothetical protein